MIPFVNCLARHAHFLFLVCAAIFLGDTASVRAVDRPATPDEEIGRLDARELIRRAVERDEALRRANAGYLHDEEITIEQLDTAGQRISTQDKRRRNVVQREDLGASDTLRGGGSKKAKVADKDARDAENFSVSIDLRTLASQFELQREADARSDDGRPCYVISFRPRAGEQSYKNREEKVIQQLSGRFWLAKDDLSITQSEGSLTRPVPVALVASVYQLNFVYRAQTLPGTKTTVPARFTLDLGVKAPFYHARQRQTTTMKDFRKN